MSFCCVICFSSEKPKRASYYKDSICDKCGNDENITTSFNDIAHKYGIKAFMLKDCDLFYYPATHSIRKTSRFIIIQIENLILKFIKEKRYSRGKHKISLSKEEKKKIKERKNQRDAFLSFVKNDINDLLLKNNVTIDDFLDPHIDTAINNTFSLSNDKNDIFYKEMKIVNDIQSLVKNRKKMKSLDKLIDNKFKNQNDKQIIKSLPLYTNFIYSNKSIKSVFNEILYLLDQYNYNSCYNSFYNNDNKYDYNYNNDEDDHKSDSYNKNLLKAQLIDLIPEEYLSIALSHELYTHFDNNKYYTLDYIIKEIGTTINNMMLIDFGDS